MGEHTESQLCEDVERERDGFFDKYLHWKCLAESYKAQVAERIEERDFLLKLRDERIAELAGDLEASGQRVLAHEARADEMQHARDAMADELDTALARVTELEARYALMRSSALIDLSRRKRHAMIVVAERDAALARVAELERENEELREKAWKYDELCK